MVQARIRKLTYNPDDVTPRIAHFGVGNFHRSHQAMYLDRLISLDGHNDWGIVGIGVMSGDVRMRDALASQDYRYTLVEKSGDGSLTAQVIGSIRGFLFAPEAPASVLDTLTNPAIRIVSLTITEGGYTVRDPHDCTSVFGYITEALHRRREQGINPFTVMSCDNVPGNGDVTKQAGLTVAHARDPEFADWIESYVTFPNSMVDRITPVTTDADRALVKQQFGIDDAWPVVTEPFTQWVLEDHFCNGRPEFEKVGVQLVDNVAPYELMKLRLLNASHQAVAYNGMLLGHTFVHESVADPDIERFVRAYLREALPTLAPVPGINLNEYIETVFERFRNPFIADTLARLAVDASDRIPKFVLPAIRDNLAAGRAIDAGASVIAHWAKHLTVAETVVDPLAEELIQRAKSDDLLAFARYEPVFGDLALSEAFRRAYQSKRSLLN